MSTDLDIGGLSAAHVKPDFDAWYVNWGDGIEVKGWIILSPLSNIRTLVIEARLGAAPIGKIAIDTSGPERRLSFIVGCTEKFAPIDIVTGRLRLFASQIGESWEIEVRPNDKLLTWMAKVAFGDCIFQHIRDTDSAKFILERLEQRFGPTLIGERHVESPREPPVDKEKDLTALLHRVGTISKDRSAILGRNGTIFLYEGNNSLFTQYQQEVLSPIGRTLASQWTDIISSRARFFFNRGIPFVQIIIPEKTSALENLFPIPIKAPTRLLAEIETRAKESPDIFGQNYVSMTDAFAKSCDVEQYYLKTDSHFSARGAMATTRILLTALAGRNQKVANHLAMVDDLLARAQSPETPNRLLSGDMANRFFGVPLYEEDLHITYETLFGEQDRVVLEEHFKPPGGNLTNTRMVWSHAGAPLDLRVLAFGNSFFERGGAPTGLSWWFKHLFAEFHLIWSRDINPEYIGKIGPDLVICQTIERFLTAVPSV